MKRRCRCGACRSLVEQATQEPREHHRRAVVAAAAPCSSLHVLERRHRIVHDAQLVLPRDLALSLADAEQLAETGSWRAREEFESDHGGSLSAEPIASSQAAGDAARRPGR